MEPTLNPPLVKDFDNLRFSVTSQFMTNYESSEQFVATHHRAVSRNERGDYLFFCGGYSAGVLHIYQFTEKEGSNHPHHRECVTLNLQAMKFVFHDSDKIKAHIGPGGKTILALMGSSDDVPALAWSVVNGESSAWHVVPLKAKPEGWETFLTVDGELFCIVYEKLRGKNCIQVIDKNGKASDLELPIDSMSVIDVKPLQLSRLHGITLMVVCKDPIGRNHVFVINNNVLSKGIRPVYASEIVLDRVLNPSHAGVYEEWGKDSRIFVFANGADNPGAGFTGMQAFEIHAVPNPNPFERVYDWNPEYLFDATCEVTHSYLSSSSAELSIWLAGDFKEEGHWLMRAAQYPEGWTLPIPLTEIHSAAIDKVIVVQHPKSADLDIFVDLPQANSGSIKLMHFWADKQSTLWKMQEVLIENEDDEEVTEVSTATTYLNVGPLTADLPVMARDLEISATEEVSVRVGKSFYQLEPGNWLKVQTDANGDLCIAAKPHDLNTPVYFVGIPGSRNVLRIDTSYYTSRKLQDPATRFTGPDVSAADEKAYREFAIDAAKKAADLSGFSDPLTVCLRSNSLRAQAGTGKSGRMKKSAKKQPSTFLYGIRFDDGTAHIITNRKDYDKLLKLHRAALKAGIFKKVAHAVSRAANAVVHTAGDVIHAVSNTVKEIAFFIAERVEGAVKFTLHLAEGLIEIIAKTAEECWAALSGILKRVWKDIKACVEMIGYLFAWDDFKVMLHALNNLSMIGLDSMAARFSSGSTWRMNLDAGFAQFEQQVGGKNWVDNGAGAQKDRGHSIYESVMHAPELKFILDTLSRCEEKLSRLLGEPVSRDYAAYFKQVNADPAVKIARQARKMRKDELVNTPNSFVQLIRNQAALAVKGVRQGVNDSLNEIRADILAYKKDAEDDLHVGLLKKVFGLITGSREMNKHNYHVLLATIPATIAYKTAIQVSNEKNEKKKTGAAKLVYNKKLLQALADAQTEEELAAIFLPSQGLKSGLGSAVTDWFGSVKTDAERIYHITAVQVSLNAGIQIVSSILAARKNGHVSTTSKVLSGAKFVYNIASVVPRIRDSKDDALKVKLSQITLAKELHVIMGFMLPEAGKVTKMTVAEAELLSGVSVLLGLVPLVVCTTAYAKKYNTWDYLDLVWKVDDGIGLASKFLLNEKYGMQEEAIVALTASTMAACIFIVIDITEEEPARLIN